MKDTWDLENNINSFSNYSDQIRLVCQSFLDQKLDEDGVVNALEGIAVLIELHESKTFDSFKKTFNLDEYYRKNETSIAACTAGDVYL